MNWFERHLNWTYGIAGLLYFAVVTPLGRMSWGLISWLILIMVTGLFIWLGVWVLRRKNRELWPAILSPIVLGWLYILMQDNRSEEVLAARERKYLS